MAPINLRSSPTKRKEGGDDNDDDDEDDNDDDDGRPVRITFHHLEQWPPMDVIDTSDFYKAISSLKKS